MKKVEPFIHERLDLYEIRSRIQIKNIKLFLFLHSK